MRFQNPFDMLRTQRILGPQPNPTTGHQRFVRNPMSSTAVPPEQQRSDADRYFDEFNRLQTEVGPGIQAYQKHLESMPNREDYKPGWMTRIAAALSGLGAGYRDPAAGVETAMNVNQADYGSALQDYANRGAGLRERAGLEQEELNSKLRALQQARALGLKYDEFELRRLETEAKMETEQMNAQSARMRAEAYAKAQARPGYDAHAQEDGSVLYVNKNNPSDRQVVPAKTVQAGQLGVSRGNLAVAQGNLANSVRRTNIYDRSQQDASRRGWTGLSIQNNRTSRSGIPNPREQQDAEDMALRQMMADPVFSEFIEEDDNGFPMPVSDDGSEDYQDFIAALNAKVQEILAGSSPRRVIR